MNVLVTGGAGYVGSHTSRLLAKAGHTVWVYDNLSRGHRAAVAADSLIEGELSDRPRLISVMQEKKIDAVLHFAALIEVGESVTDPGKYYQNNLVCTLNLLEAMRTADVKKIVFSSTAAVYGIPKEIPITEQAPTAPINPYGFTKLAIERALGDYAHAYDFSYAALRYFNASGATPSGEIGEDHQPESHLIPLVLQVALGQREKIFIFGDDFPTPDGTCIRDYIHVEDLGSAHVKALDHLSPGAELKLNLGVGRGFSVKEVIEACRRVTGHPIPAETTDRRDGDPPQLVADSTQARQILGWEPQHTEIESIITTAWRWHKAHPQGYNDR